MRAQDRPLDLNDLPEDDFFRDGNKPYFEAGRSSSAVCNGGRKKNIGKDGTEKVYECRFCFLKFCKSQALGGHMNRHRQEKETEAMNRARQMVFGTDHNLAVPHLGFQPVYPPPRLYSGASSSAAATSQQPPHPPPQQPPPPPSQLAYLHPSHFRSTSPHYVNDYYVGQSPGQGHQHDLCSRVGRRTGVELHLYQARAAVQDRSSLMNLFQDHGFL